MDQKLALEKSLAILCDWRRRRLEPQQAIDSVVKMLNDIDAATTARPVDECVNLPAGS